MEYLAIAVGAFYLLGGLVSVRAARMNSMLDSAMSQISMQPVARDERIIGLWMFAASILTTASGVTLILLHGWAVWAFLACWGAQAVFLLWAQTRPDTGTRATKNAFIIYSGVTAWVVWMGASGRLAGWF